MPTMTTTLIEALSAYIGYSNKLTNRFNNPVSAGYKKGLKVTQEKKKNQNIWTQCTP